MKKPMSPFSPEWRELNAKEKEAIIDGFTEEERLNFIGSALVAMYAWIPKGTFKDRQESLEIVDSVKPLFDHPDKREGFTKIREMFEHNVEYYNDLSRANDWPDEIV